MKHKIAEEFMDQSLGFPVLLKTVPMKKVRSEWVPDLPLNQFQRVVLWILAHKASPLTGKQVRFIRHWLEKTQKEFAAMHDVTHAAVSKWEAKNHDPTGMSKPTEILLRLNVLTALPRDVWQRLEGPDTVDDKPASLKRLLDEVSRFDEKPPFDQSVTIPEGYLSDTAQPSLG